MNDIASASVSDTTPGATSQPVAPLVGPRLPERELLGIPFAVLDLPGVAALLADRPDTAPFAYVATPNTHHLVSRF